MRPAKNENPGSLIGHIPSDSLPTHTQKERRIQTVAQSRYSDSSVRFHSEVFVRTNGRVIISLSTTNRFKRMIVVPGLGGTDILGIRVQFP
jgi:hypothetical protein